MRHKAWSRNAHKDKAPDVIILRRDSRPGTTARSGSSTNQLYKRNRFWRRGGNQSTSPTIRAQQVRSPQPTPVMLRGPAGKRCPAMSTAREAVHLLASVLTCERKHGRGRRPHVTTMMSADSTCRPASQGTSITGNKHGSDWLSSVASELT